MLYGKYQILAENGSILYRFSKHLHNPVLIISTKGKTYVTMWVLRMVIRMKGIYAVIWIRAVLRQGGQEGGSGYPGSDARNQKIH